MTDKDYMNSIMQEVYVENRLERGFSCCELQNSSQRKDECAQNPRIPKEFFVFN